MKTLKITTDNKVSIIEIDFDNYMSFNKALGSDIFEVVKTQKMYNYFEQPMMICVDEEGFLKRLPINVFGCFLYNTELHGHPICGDIVLAVPVGPDMVAPDNPEQLLKKLVNDFEYLKEE